MHRKLWGMSGARLILFGVYMTAFLLLAAYLVFFTDMWDRKAAGDAVDFSQDWLTGSNVPVNIDGIEAGDFGGRVLLRKQLPDQIAYGEALCFITNNARVTVWIGDQTIYCFEPGTNLTGAGYEYAYHTVGLSPKDSWKTVRVELETVFATNDGGGVEETFLCSAENYIRLLIGERLLPFFLSLLVLFFGLLLVAAFFCIPKKTAMPYNVAALGVCIVLFGVWCLADTGVPQLMTGDIHVYRVMDYLLLHLAEYPIVCFLVSTTQQKRRIYQYVMFALSAFFISLLLGLRCFAGIDMHLLKPVIYASYFSCIVVIGALEADDFRYCRSRGLRVGIDDLFVGGVCLALGGLLDVVSYLLGFHFLNSDGNFLRLGLCAFVVSVMLQFLRWWSGEHTAINRDRFINRILQYAVSANDPEAGINAVLESLGTDLHADRAYVFEDMGDGTFDNTYEWCRAGVSAEIENLKGLPYEGTVDVWYDEYKRSKHVLIYDLEAYRGVSENMYQVLKPQGIRSLVTGPLEMNGKFMGFFGVDNPPVESMMEIAEIIGLLSYFLSQLLLQREEQKRLVRYSYYDAMTGCKNRRALGEYEKNHFDPTRPYGFIMCDINGLKAANDTYGHDAGDAMIIDVSGSLAEVFGLENVYRMGGDEFAVCAYRADEAAFRADLERARALIVGKGRSAAIGAVFRPGGAADYEAAKAEADQLMYEDKRRYYQGRNDRRR